MRRQWRSAVVGRVAVDVRTVAPSAGHDGPRRAERERGRFPSGTSVAQLPLTATFAPLEEIAGRRNEIAHGAPSELMAPDILTDWIEFVEQFGQAVVRVLRQELLQAEVSYRATALPAPIAPPSYGTRRTR